jgi:hypothetical protein
MVVETTTMTTTGRADMEAGLVFDFHGGMIHWHVPPDRSAGALPDSSDLWKILWDNREILGGVAHTHPWSGAAHPSQTDVTTFAAIEAGLGERLVWPIVTFSEVQYYTWVGPERLNYGVMERRRFRLHRDDIDHLRELSR